MSINVNNLSKADLVKLAMQKQSGKISTANQPSYMTKNGSIFNAPNLQNTAQTTKSEKTSTSDGIAKLNNTQNSQESKLYNNLDNIKTADQGREAIAQLKQDMEGMNPLQKLPMQAKLNKLQEKQKDLAKQEFEDSQANLKSIAQGNRAIDKDGTSTKGASSKSSGNVSAEDGKAQAEDAKQENAKLEKQTAETEKDAKEVQGYQKDAKKTQQNVKKDEAKFNKEIAKESKTIQANQQEMAKESEKMATTRAEIDSLQAELQSLTADNTGIGERSAFSLKLAGEQSPQQANGSFNSNSASDDTNSRVAELQAQIGEKAGTMEVSGQKLQKLQTSTNKSITVMHNKVRLKSIYYQTAQKTMEAEQKTTDKILKVANKVDDISQTVSQVGKTLQYVGKGMIIAGKAMTCNPFTAAAGAALITAGGFTQKTGTVTELVGNYGSAAANVTKAACNAANGNFAAALQCAGAAIQSGAAAAKGTESLKENMNAINDQVENAKNELAAGTAANQAAKEMAQQAKEVGEDGKLSEMGQAFKDSGMTRKQAAAGMKAEMLGKINSGEISGDQLLDQVRNKNGATLSQATSAAQGSFGKVSSDFAKAELTGQQALRDAGKELSDKNIKKATDTAYKNSLAKSTGTGAGSKLIKQGSSSYDKLAQVGKGLTEIGAKASKGTQQAGRSKSKSYSYPNYTIDYNRLARGEKLMNRRV